MNQENSVFIVEDNALNRITLETILEDHNYNIVGSYANAEEAWEVLKNTNVAIVLIDINLAGDKDGIWLGSKIRKYKNTAFVYLTAYGDKETIHKVKKTNPNGYLMKPYNEPTLLTTIDIAIANFVKVKQAASPSIYIKDSSIRVKLNLNEINYIQSDGNYLQIFLDDKQHLVRAKLTDFLELLPDAIFAQVHQRYAINLSKVDLIGNGFIMVRKEEIPVSKRFKTIIENRVNQF
jgi:DNA-binding LytR/AlgR family response regulator